MVATRKFVNLEERPDLRRLVEESTTAHTSIVVRKDGEDVAIIMPIPSKSIERRGKTAEDYEAFLSAAGSWSDVDTDELVEKIYESRNLSTRPRVDL